MIIHQALEDTAANIRQDIAIMDSALRSALSDTAASIPMRPCGILPKISVLPCTTPLEIFVPIWRLWMVPFVVH